MTYLRFCLPLMLASLLLAGCGDGKSTVTGTVTMDGTPLTGGNVSFMPEGGGPMASGAISETGEFTLYTNANPGAAPGKYKVTVNPPFEASGGSAGDGSTSQPSGNEKKVRSIPQKYQNSSTTDLKAEVKAGANDPIKIELKSK